MPGNAQDIYELNDKNFHHIHVHVQSVSHYTINLSHWRGQEWLLKRTEKGTCTRIFINGYGHLSLHGVKMAMRPGQRWLQFIFTPKRDHNWKTLTTVHTNHFVWHKTPNRNDFQEKSLRPASPLVFRFSRHQKWFGEKCEKLVASEKKSVALATL